MAGTACSVVRGIAGPLATVFRDVDAELVSAGDRLAADVETFGEIGATFEALPRTLDSREIGEASEALGGVARALAAMSTRLAEERAAMGALGALHMRVGRSIQRLQETVGAIGILAINSHIAAATIASGTEDLTGFTRDITKLVATAEAAVAGYRREHAAVAELLHFAASRQAQFEQLYGGTLRTVAARIESSLRDIAARQGRTASAAAAIRDRSGKISADIGVVVMALQVGDVTRQRLEHVTHALEVLERGLEEASAEPWRDGLDAAGQAAVVEAAARMQAAQLRDTAGDFAAELGRIVSALGKLGEESRGLVSVGAETYGEGGRSGTSFLAGLERSLAEAADLLTRCRDARLEVDRAMAEVGTRLSTVLGQLGSVREIETDMRLVGLNATFKCARLGAEGRTLSAIAQELRAYANQTVECADALIAVVRETLSAAEVFDHGAAAEGAARIEALGRSMADALGVMRTMGDRMDEALGLLGRQGEAVSVTLAEMAGGLPAAAALAPALAGSAAKLDGLAAGHAGGTLDAALLAERLGLFGGRSYTMASERLIHRQFTASPGAETPLPAAADELDDILF